MGRPNLSRDIILKTLAKAGKHTLRYEELVEQTKLSKTTISDQLKKLLEEGIVERIQTTESYPPPVYYKSLESEEELEKRVLLDDLLVDRLQNTTDMFIFLEITSNISAIHELLMVTRLQRSLNTSITERYQEADDYQERLKDAVVQTPSELKGLKLAIVGLASRLFWILWQKPQLLDIEVDETLQAKAEKHPSMPAIPSLGILEYQPSIPKEIPKELIEPKSPHGQLLRNIQDFSDRVWQIETLQEFGVLQEVFLQRVYAKLISLLFQKNAKLLTSPEKVDKEITDSFLASWIEEGPIYTEAEAPIPSWLREGAEHLGITTQGKTNVQLKQEIDQKMSIEAPISPWLSESAERLGISIQGKTTEQIEQEFAQNLIEGVEPLGVVIEGKGKDLRQIVQEIFQKMRELATQLGINIEGKDIVPLSQEIEAKLQKKEK